MHGDSSAATPAAGMTSAGDTPPSKREVKRRRLGAADAREAILAAAESLLVEAGPEGLRLTEVAMRAGVSHPNVLYHFGSAAELQAQLAQRVAARLANEVVSAFGTGAPGCLPVDRAVEAVFRVFDERGYARLLAWLELSGNEPAWEVLREKLELLSSFVASHPALQGEANAALRLRVVPTIQLVILAAIGFGLSGRTVQHLFTADERRPSVVRVLSEFLAVPRTPPALGGS